MQAFRMTFGWRRAGPAGGGPDYAEAAAERAMAFHRGFPEYRQTPLTPLPALAAELGLGEIYIKDESFRFGLDAFKVLGGSYAIGTLLSEKLGLPEPSVAALISPEAREKLGNMTFITATDGNHGRGVAWTAARLSQRSIVYMPAGTAPERLANIRALGSDASITDLGYDDAVRLAAAQAEQYGYIRIQDTDSPGYERIPKLIMQGYLTMALEIVRELRQPPTHVFLQAGVGSMAGALAAFFAGYYGCTRPKAVIVEPDRADCIYRTAAADDGRRHFTAGRMDTIMAGLACGEPCQAAWELIRDSADACVTCPDYAAANGMRILSPPLGEDRRIISGESGASGLGMAAELMRKPGLADMRQALGLGGDSRVLCISTEGATDRENYRRIVWDGWYSKDRE